MSEILCSTGALIGRLNHRDFRLLGPFTEKLHCDGYELMMYEDWYQKVDELIAEIQSLHLHIPVLHCEKFIGEKIGNGQFELAYQLFEVNCQIAKKIGATKMVMHLWNGMISDNHFDHNIEAYPRLVSIADRYEIDLLVENVVCNHEDPMKHWCELREKYPDIHFTYDTKMAEFHKQVDLIYQEEYEWLWKENHIHHYHVNDYAGGYMDWSNLRVLPIGKGQIDFQRFYRFIHDIGYDDTFTLEATAMRSDGSVDFDMLNEQFETIRLGLKKE